MSARLYLMWNVSDDRCGRVVFENGMGQKI